jgi:hypothetical protein
MKTQTGKGLLPELGLVSTCACQDIAALFRIEDKEYIGQFDGSIAVSVGQPSVDAKGLMTIPLNIVGYTTTSQIKGMGETTLDFDFDRPIPPSSLKGSKRDSFFPATQTMHLNILMSTESLPGVTLRSIRRGTLVNRSATSFPPAQGSIYSLQRPVELEDVKKPGKVRARLLNVNTEIVEVNTSPKEVKADSGLTLLPSSSEGFVLKELTQNTSLKFRLAEKGKVKTTIFDSRGREVLVVADKPMSAGEREVTFDGRELKGKEYYYQIQVDGRNRTARMLLVKR